MPSDLRTIWIQLLNRPEGELAELDGELKAIASVEQAEGKWLLTLQGHGWRQFKQPKSHWAYLDFHVSPIGSQPETLTLKFSPTNIDCRDVLWHALVQDILASLRESRSSKAKALATVLAKWKNVWPKQEEKKPEFLQGLFGELFMIEELLDHKIPHEKVIQSWEGPSKKVHDFQFPGCHIEVKSTKGKGKTITITAVTQLESPKPNPRVQNSISATLYLSHVRLGDAAGKTNCLNALVERIEQRLEPFPQSLELFRRKLGLWGFWKVFHETREKIAFERKGIEYYAVTDGFPRLVDIPRPVKVTRYTVDLRGVREDLCGKKTECLDSVRLSAQRISEID